MSWQDLLRHLQGDLTSPDQKATGRDEDAWREVSFRLRRLAEEVHMGLSAVDLEDLTQETLLKLQTGNLLDRLVDSRNPENYLITVLRHSGLDLWRKRQREEPLREAADELAAPAETRWVPEDPRRSSALGAALRQLTQEEREILALRFWKGLSIAEIARQRREPYSRVAVRLYRLTKRLAPLIREVEEQAEKPRRPP